MKLVIDISDEMYNDIKYGFICQEYADAIISKVCKHSTSFDDLINKIKHKIQKIYCGEKQEPFSRLAPCGFYITGDGVKELVLEIIDEQVKENIK